MRSSASWASGSSCGASRATASARGPNTLDKPTGPSVQTFWPSGVQDESAARPLDPERLNTRTSEHPLLRWERILLKLSGEAFAGAVPLDGGNRDTIDLD